MEVSVSALSAMGAVLVAPVLVATVLVAVYNRLVTLRQRCRNAFSQIDVQLQRRHALVPNLVATARGYLAHESDTLEAVAAARGLAAAAAGRAAATSGGARDMVELGAAESGLGRSLGRLMALVERYPALRADRTMAQLSEDLSATENRIAFARQAYNDAVMRYNSMRESVPAVWVAPSFGFEAAAYFRLENDREAAVPPVSVG
jgi:LemA protein